MTRRGQPTAAQRRYLETVVVCSDPMEVIAATRSTREACRNAGWVRDGKITPLGLAALEGRP